MFHMLFQRLRIAATPVRQFCNVIKNNEALDGVATTTPAVLVTQKNWEFEPVYTEPRQAWIENFDTAEEAKLGIIELHPDVFAVSPRIDIIFRNVSWQRRYRWVSYAHSKTRAEVRGGGRKPWPQKGLGRSRQGSIRSPLWPGGGVCHGPRAYTTHFFMLPYNTRVLGLTSMLSVKLAQDDLHIVNSLEIPTDNKDFLKDMIEKRNWGPSVLIIDDNDIMPKNITLASDDIPYVNLMPVYGLNVYSMLKHDTLVLTVSAVERIEEKILEALHSATNRDKKASMKKRLDQ